MAAPFLSNLGVTEIQQARTPTAEAFPLAFNPNNKSEWTAAVHELVTTGEPETDWGLTIRRYVELCAARGVYAFQSVHQTRNDQISDYLRDRRRAFIHFINISHFFDTVKLRTTERKVTVTDRGFVLQVDATATIKDPSFEKWLTKMPMPRFDIVRHDGRYTKAIQDGLLMYAYNERQSNSPERWHVGYEITCPIYPDLPDQHLPSRAELENFVLNILWMPLLRGMRPNAMTHRLI